MSKKFRFLFLLVRTYWSLAEGFGDFVALLRLRLSCTPLGRNWLRKRFRSSVSIPPLGGPVLLRSHTTDLSVLSEIFVKREYDSLCAAASEPVAAIVDLGANTGLVSRFFLHRFPEARLLAVEPEPGNFSVLQANLNALDARAQPVEACVGSTDRRVRMETAEGEWGYRMVETIPEGFDGIPVKPLKDLLDHAGFDTVDLLKCDIEGAEAEVFAHCGEWISRVGLLLVECHGEFKVEDLLAALETTASRFELLERRHEGSQEIVLLRNIGEPPPK